MDDGMRTALIEYGRTIGRNGFQAGEPIIRKYSAKYRDFEKWAAALGIMLRARELLERARGEAS